MNDILLITRAFNFVCKRHSDKRRKGQTQEPYVNHLAEVASLVAEATNGKDPNLIAAALLHDTVEDTKTDLDELVVEFNKEIATLVEEVTDDKALRKEDRKARQIAHAPKKTPKARLLTIADKTSNLRSIANSPPENWDAVRKKEYIDWAVKVVSGLGDVPTALKNQFNMAKQKAKESI